MYLKAKGTHGISGSSGGDLTGKPKARAASFSQAPRPQNDKRRLVVQKESYIINLSVANSSSLTASSSSESLGQLEGLEPGRVRLSKFDSQKSKSLFRKDLP